MSRAIQKLYYNIVVIIILAGIGFLFTQAMMAMMGDLSQVNQPIILDWWALPQYAMRTITRFSASMLFSIIIAIFYGTLAAKNKRMECILIPIVDIMQAIPVLGFLSFTVVFFVNLAPKSIWGIEMAIIFAIFSAQVWNMIFSVYQSMLSVPNDLYQTAKAYGLNGWQIFWRVELPYAMPGLIWNGIMSMCGSWYFVVASEVVSVGVNNYTVPGMGAYLALALKQMDLAAVINVFLAILVIMVIFNELLFKPLIAWSYKFRYEFSIGNYSAPRSWFLNCLQGSVLLTCVMIPIRFVTKAILYVTLPKFIVRRSTFIARLLEVIWWCVVIYASYIVSTKIYTLCVGHLSIDEVYNIIKLGLITGLRVMGLAVLTSIIWVPVGVFIGLRPSLASFIQPINLFLTSIPANIYYPLFVIMILRFNLNKDIWLSFMIIIGSQWYILYNVISGAQTIPSEMLEIADIFKLSNFTKSTKIILPTILPFYITGIITCTGGAWNASVVSEIVTWGNDTLITPGLGSYIAIHTKNGDFPEIAVGLIVMSILVVGINSLVLQPLYDYAADKFRLE
jgi:NitT/TauT family transport system permease protein